MNQYDNIVKACANLLDNYPGADNIKQYLSARASNQAIKRFEFGYFPDNENIDALLSSVDDEVLFNANLRYEKFNNNGVYRKVKCSVLEHHNLIMPYRDAYGNIVALVGRTILSEKDMKNLNVSKYKNTSFEKKSHVFGLYDAKSTIIKNDCAFIVEGQFDCITAHDIGITNVVALGSASMTLYQLGLIMRYTKNIYLFLDNDEAGIAGTARIMNRLGSYANFVPKRIPLGYKDLDEYIKDSPNITYLDLARL